MADPENNENMESMDDTKTRKTVRLQPSTGTPLSIKLPKPGMPLSDPLSGRDTDTGNLEVMEDTQTRKTVKLKPIAPPPSTGRIGMINVQAGVPAAAPKTDGDNTQTRKTVVLKPTTVSPASVSVAPTPSAEAVSDADDTQTRKTVRLKGSAAPPTTLKITPPGVPAAPSVMSPPAPAAPDAESGTVESSETIKISRPRPGGGMIPPRPAVAPAPFSPSKATMVLPGVQVQSEDEVPTHSLPAQKPLPDKIVGPEAFSAAGAKPTPRAAIGVAAPVASTTPKAPPPPKAEPEAEAKPKNDDDDDIVVKKPEPTAVAGALDDKAAPKIKKAASGAQPSALYLVLGILTLVAVLGSATFSTVQYLNLHQKQNIQIPGLPSTTK